jgi:hypothetical protein
VLHAALQAGPVHHAPCTTSNTSDLGDSAAIAALWGCGNGLNDRQLDGIVQPQAGRLAGDGSSCSSGESRASGLSPIKESTAEGESPGPPSRSSSRPWPSQAGPGTAKAHYPAAARSQTQPQQQQQQCWKAADSVCERRSQLQTLQPLQSQLGPLTLLARALLEAQTELFSSRRQQQEQQQGQSGVAITGQAPDPAVEAVVVKTRCTFGLQQASDNPSCKENAPANSHGQQPGAQLLDEEQEGTAAPCHSQQQFIVSSSTPSATCSRSCPPDATGEGPCSQRLAEAGEVAKLSSLGPGCRNNSVGVSWSTQREQQGQPQQCGAAAFYDFDPALLDIVEDVEGLLAPSAELAAPQHPWPVGGGLHGSRQATCRAHSWGEVYEENDILSLLAAIE